MMIVRSPGWFPGGSHGFSPVGGPARPYIVWEDRLHGSSSRIHALESYPSTFLVGPHYIRLV
jgi:hypothetical protein